MTHTKGPWMIQSDPEYPEGLHPLHHNRYITNGTLDSNPHEKASIICALRDQENQRADALLIASAPELLEACKEMLQCICDYNNGEDSEVNSWINYWEKTIKKAEGK